MESVLITTVMIFMMLAVTGSDPCDDKPCDHDELCSSDSDEYTCTEVDCSLIRLAGTRFHEEYHGDYIRMADSECEDMPVYKLSWDKFKNVYFYMYDTSWYLGPSRCSRYAYLKRDSPRMPYFSVDEPWRELRSSSYGIYPSIKVYCPGSGIPTQPIILTELLSSTMASTTAGEGDDSRESGNPGFCPIIQVTGTNRHKSVVGFYLLFPGLFCSLKPVYQLSNSKGSFYIYFFKSDLVAITGWAVGDAPCNNTFVLIRESPVEPYLPAKQPWKEIKRKGGTTKNSDINVVCGGKTTPNPEEANPSSFASRLTTTTANETDEEESGDKDPTDKPIASEEDIGSEEEQGGEGVTMVTEQDTSVETTTKKSSGSVTHPHRVQIACMVMFTLKTWLL